MTEVSVVRSDALSTDLAASLRALLDEAFAGEIRNQDWEHALGGWHAVVSEGGRPLAHAAVVERPIDVGGRRFRAGYVEAVATAPGAQGAGHGTRVMRAINDIIRRDFELGVLGTGAHHFYERLGWERWQGLTYVIRPDGRVRSPDEDDAIMVLRTGPSVSVSLRESIACTERDGDDW